MAKHGRQVQVLAETRRLLEDFEKMGLRGALDAKTEREKQPFGEAGGKLRRYPGESEGGYLAEYLNNARRSNKQDRLLKSVRVVQQVAQAAYKHDIAAIDRLRKRGMNFAYTTLRTAINNEISGKLGWAFGVEESGFTIRATTPDGKVALAVLLLEKHYRLTRVRQCLHCGSWFYARFTHQQFCNDATKRCQWNHYHTPEWRKDHRERNRRHQREYRKRLFGKGRE
jgi:hypothetical protein